MVTTPAARPPVAAHTAGRRLGGSIEREASLKRISRASITSAAIATIAVAGVAGVALAQEPGAVSADPAVATLERQNADLRRQLTSERNRHQKALRTERIHRATLTRRFQHQLRTRPSVRHALQVAAATYGVPESRLTRVATCESTLRPDAANGPYAGLFQFGTPLWSKTPYREFSRNDPYAAALAASWAFSRGMAGHWPICGRR